MFNHAAFLKARESVRGTCVHDTTPHRRWASASAKSTWPPASTVACQVFDWFMMQSCANCCCDGDKRQPVMKQAIGTGSCMISSTVALNGLSLWSPFSLAPKLGNVTMCRCCARRALGHVPRDVGHLVRRNQAAHPGPLWWRVPLLQHGRPMAAPALYHELHHCH